MPHPRSLRAFLPLLAALLAASVSLTGCLSSKYRKARSDTPPAVAINIPARESPAATGLIHAVIVKKGPGSWKREAWWDEYVLTFSNRGGEPLELLSATLTDFQDQASAPGDQPWKLEKESQTWYERLHRSQAGPLLALGAGTVVAAEVAMASAFSTFLSGGAASGAGAAAAATVVVLPVYAVGLVAVNQHNKHAIADEFQRRRLVLPATLAPGAERSGSLFFRISPGPHGLDVAYRQGAETGTLHFDLAPLADLHLARQRAAHAPAAAAEPKH